MSLDWLLRDVRLAIRALARTPAFALTVVITLALGIGANSAVFSALDAVLLRPLPFPDGDRLVQVMETREQTPESKIAPVRLEEWNQLNTTFEAITGHYTEDVSDTSGELPEKVTRATVAPRFIDVWGVPPLLGRGFTDAEHHVGGPAAILISHRYWRARLGGDPHVLERSIRIGTESFPVVGVMPASFFFPDREVDLWSPVHVDSATARRRLVNWFAGVGRLKSGVTLERAQSNLDAVQARLAEQHPESDARIGVRIVPLKETMVSELRASLWLLFGAVTVLLLITCTNVAALLLSRAAHRQQEIAVRLSLGATRAAVARSLLVETTLLVLGGAVVGLLFAGGVTALLRSVGANLPRLDEIALDGRILLYMLASTVAVASVCGALPAMRATRHGLAGALSDVGRGQVSTRNPLQWMLVGAQVALSVTLLTGAGLLLRSFQELSRVDPGFTASRVLTFRMSGSWVDTQDLKGLAQRFERTLEALRALPGVDAAATSLVPPGTSTRRETTFQLAEAPTSADQPMVAEARGVSPGYFVTMQIPLVDGERCRAQEPRAPRDVMVNELFATRYLSDWPSPVGLHLSRGGDAASVHRIVGVVASVRERGLERPAAPTVYWCADWNPIPYFLVRTRQQPEALAQTVRLALKDLEPLRSVYDIVPLDQRISEAFAETRVRMLLLLLFAGTALLLACVGLYGTLSYLVNAREREVGVRLALGALRRDIVRQFLVQGLRIVAVSCVCGMLLSLGLSRTLSGMLYGVSTLDPLTIVGVVGIVLGVTALAALIPAARAGLVDPMGALRDE